MDRGLVVKKNVRDSRFELMRIVAMLMIIIFHICLHSINDTQISESGGPFNSPDIFHKMLIPTTFMQFGNIGNALFILISGYFMAGREKISLSKTATKLLSQLAFASLALVLLSMVIIDKETGVHFFIHDLSIFNTDWWFIGYYFVIILIGSLFLNKKIAQMDSRTYAGLIVVIFALVSFQWSRGRLDTMIDSFNYVLLGTVYYLVGGYAKKYDMMSRLRTWVIWAAMLMSWVFLWMSEINFIQLKIENYNVSGSTDEFFQQLIRFSAFHPIYVIISVSIFELMRRLPSFHSRFINFLGGSTFMIYMIHENKFMQNIYSKISWLDTLYKSPVRFLEYMCIAALVLFCVGLAVYIVYRLVAWIMGKLRFIAIRN